MRLLIKDVKKLLKGSVFKPLIFTKNLNYISAVLTLEADTISPKQIESELSSIFNKIEIKEIKYIYQVEMFYIGVNIIGCFKLCKLHLNVKCILFCYSKK